MIFTHHKSLKSMEFIAHLTARTFAISPRNHVELSQMPTLIKCPGTFPQPSHQSFQFLLKSLDCALMQIRQIRTRCIDSQMYLNIPPVMPQICCNSSIFVSDLERPSNRSLRVADLNGSCAKSKRAQLSIRVANKHLRFLLPWKRE